MTISNTDSYDRNVDFTIELGTPWWVKTPGTDEAEVDDVTGAKLAKPLEPGQADDGRPQLGEKCKTVFAIREAEEFRRAIDKLANSNATSLLIGTSSWGQQFREAVFIGEYENGQRPSFSVYFMHFLSLPWKTLFALVPPTEMWHGWACFIVSIMMIGVLTVFVGDLANHFGCTIGLKDTVTAITFVALGTSLPEVFASKVAAVMDDHADSAILHVCGGNAVNVFLGIGVAWAIASIYHTARGDEFRIEPAGLAFSVTLFCAGALIAIILLQYRRYAHGIHAELGGPTFSKLWTGSFFIFLWIAYLIISGMQAYCILPSF